MLTLRLSRLMGVSALGHASGIGVQVTLRFGMPEVTIRHSRCSFNKAVGFCRHSRFCTSRGEQLQLAVLDLAEIWMSSSAASLIACASCYICT